MTCFAGSENSMGGIPPADQRILGVEVQQQVDREPVGHVRLSELLLQHVSRSGRPTCL